MFPMLLIPLIVQVFFYYSGNIILLIKCNLFLENITTASQILSDVPAIQIMVQDNITLPLLNANDCIGK